MYNGVPRLHAQTPTPVAYTVYRTEYGYDKSRTLKYTTRYAEAWRSDGSSM